MHRDATTQVTTGVSAWQRCFLGIRQLWIAACRRSRPTGSYDASWCFFSDPPKPVLSWTFAHDWEFGITCDYHHHRLEEGARSSPLHGSRVWSTAGLKCPPAGTATLLPQWNGLVCDTNGSLQTPIQPVPLHLFPNNFGRWSNRWKHITISQDQLTKDWRPNQA